VNRLDEVVVFAQRQRLGVSQRALELIGQFIHSHAILSSGD
jgi:hypothetical protein